MKVLKSLNSLYVEGSDSYTFIDSLVSNSINENEYKYSYLLGPDGKVNFWFIFSRQNDLLKIYQSESNLIELKKLKLSVKLILKFYSLIFTIIFNYIHIMNHTFIKSSFCNFHKLWFISQFYNFF